MKSLVTVALTLLLSSLPAAAAVLPGFRVAEVGKPSGFVTSLVVDSQGQLLYTTNDGRIFRFVSSAESVLLGRVVTTGEGNSGLLGMALLDDGHAVVHYTTPKQTYDVVSVIDLATGEERELQRFVCDITFPERGSSTEHHGGNPIVAPDGSIFLGIGDYGGGAIAAIPEWNGGKVFRIFPDGSFVQFARGFRNPFDLAWDAARSRLIVPDNGPFGGDEIHVVNEGGYYGWPYTTGNEPPIDGAVPPEYVFPLTVAPTGIASLNGRTPLLRGGYLLATYVTRGIYWLPDLDVRPLPDPIALIDHETAPIIDVAVGGAGEIYFATPTGLFRLITPAAGDCNGDGLMNILDVDALRNELADGRSQPIAAVATGFSRGSFGCDVTADGMVDGDDAVALAAKVRSRSRPLRR